MKPSYNEAAVLGAILRDPRKLDDVSQLLHADYFRDAAHLCVWKATTELHSRGEPIDLVTTGEEMLRQAGANPPDCSLPYLHTLWDAQPTGANAVYYASIVRNDGLLRLLGYYAANLAHTANEPGDADVVLAQAESEIFALTERGVSLSTWKLEALVTEAFAAADRRGARDCRGVTGVATGFLDLDSLLSGLQPSELTILAARPSLGKTSIALNITANTALGGIPSLFASIEQSRGELTDRLICSVARIDSQRVRRGLMGPSDRAKFYEAGCRLRDAALVTIDDASQQSVQRIAANARRLKACDQLGFLVVDYLQLIHHEDAKAQRHEQVGASARRLKALARELSVPVFCLAQLNREVESRPGQRPRLADIRESGEVEQHADNVLFLHRPEADNLALIEVIVAKHRNGPTGSALLVFDRQSVHFDNYCTESPVADGYTAAFD
jgi:replicative DNA helicase